MFLVTDDDIIICDPEAEYGPLVERLHGQVIKISPTSPHYINPMDLNLNYSDDENPLSLKSDFILSLCELIVGGKDGLMPVEKTIIDRCVRMVYRDYLSDPVPENMPILEDLYNELRRQEEKEAQYIATALEIYVSGSLNVFNHRTNINIANRIVSFDIKELGKQLKKIGMLIVQDAVWNRVTVNRKPTNPPATTLTKCTFCCARSRPPPTPWKSGSASASGEVSPPASPRMSRTCSPPARWRTSLRTAISSSCSIRPAATGRFSPSSSISPRISSRMSPTAVKAKGCFLRQRHSSLCRPFPPQGTL